MSTTAYPVENQTKNQHIDPNQIQVIKREGKVVPFNPVKISLALTKAFKAVQGDAASLSSSIHEVINELTKEVTKEVVARFRIRGAVHIEEIQDIVEIALMRDGAHHQVARAYVLYRTKRQSERQAAAKTATTDTHSKLSVLMEDGSKQALNTKWIHSIIEQATKSLNDTDAQALLNETMRTLYDGVPIKDVYRAMVMAARTKIEQEPNYSYAAARLLLNDLAREVCTFLALPQCDSLDALASTYPHAFKSHIETGIKLGILDKRLKSFDLDRLGAAIKPERDLQFNYLGLQTLYDRYFIHSEGTRYELPQGFFMRVAMGLSILEDDPNERAIEFYNLLSSFDYMSSTPTLFNAGTVTPQLSSCYLSTVSDDLSGIFKAYADDAQLSKRAGGLGRDWSRVRATGAYIQGTNGKSQGVVPFLKVYNDMLVAVNQGGKRKGAGCSYLETWHLDIEEFLDLRKNTGDDRRRTHDMNTANWIPDLFMKRVAESKDWTLFSPDEVPDLHDLYGEAFERAYVEYENQAQAGNIKHYKTIPAIQLWRKMLSMLFETGHPWITFKDACNMRSPQQHTGVIHSSNLCTEITLNTADDEVAVCNLGSVNLPQHIDENGLNLEKLEKTIATAIRMLDNVIDINFYPIIEARRSNLRHRPIGLGLMGFQDALLKLNIAYASDDAVNFADNSMEAISYFAIKASNELAKTRGTYESFEGSLWSQGILPIDSLKLLQQSRGTYLDVNTTSTMDWSSLRSAVQAHGMRNSNVMAIAPTATIANICGVSASIEPIYQNLFVKSNLSGEFTVVNPYLVTELKQLGIWDLAMVEDLKYYNGTLSAIERIPNSIKNKYKTAFEMNPLWLIEAGARRQKWIDQAQSLNLYIAKPSGKLIDEIYRTAWMKGLKTTYYCRSLGATDAEKSTINSRALNAVAPNSNPQVDVECEACQ